MKRLGILFWLLGSFFVLEPVHAALLFDSTNAAAKAAGYPFLQGPTYINCGNPGDPQVSYESYGFDFTTTSQLEVTTLVLKTNTAIVGANLCAYWYNDNGANASTIPCGLVPTSANGTTTIQFPDGDHPFAYPYGTPLHFQLYDATLLSPSTTINTIPKDETAYPQLTGNLSCGNPGNYNTVTLTPATYGVPSMQIYGGEAEIFPGLIAPTLPPTSTSVTTQCPDFGFFTPFCDAVVWFVVPDTSQLAVQTSYLGSVAAAKFPFSYIASVHTALTDNDAPTSASSLVLTIPMGVTTSTGFGTFLPSSFVAFSSSTVVTYLPAATVSTMRFLMTIALLAGTITMIYYGAVKLLDESK